MRSRFALVALLFACGGAPQASTEPNAGAGPVATTAPPTTRVDPKRGGVLSLEDLLSYARVHAPTLKVARRTAGLGDAAVEGAERLLIYNPELAVTAGGRTTGGISRFEFAAELEQRLQIAGQRGARIDAAERERDAQLARLDVAEWEIHVLVHALYYALVVRQEQLVAATKLEAFADSVKTVIDKRIEAGEDSPLENIVARAELAKAAQRVIAAKAAHRTASLSIAEVVGWPAGVPLKVEGSVQAPKPVKEVEALVDHALEAHPSRRWLELEVRAAESHMEREDTSAWPDPAIGLRYGREAEPGSVGHVWTTTLRMPLPIWERNQAGRAEARAKLAIAREQKRAFKARLRARIARAAVQVNAAADTANLYGTDITPAFERNLSKLQRSFELGEIDILALAQIQERVLRVQQDALGAIATYYQRLAALEGISGKELLR